ncbi:dephospho-CoA kinase [Candidatus Peregrinibacteria bacterium CG22_combo_CG10-13_8_21_14_all_44_10]|nr:MAG: dephospho-CoA kinase [Candidatus Peregrinibacteria bacterium CG2_30_44_17]PIP66144.1 MAG: dephospho-CoA kinase [Candidatus Peregrinibacteria bacterium CG22_combo_CG10-13_8_21_14_all_44_10]PIS04210.1 MAG: dephospho-CoA kinase [Candidatus Peregrinibacteria bacterium CG10_big_fil_rev_8_21_14_0_10_44_7]PIX79789.1 MAG: dephospho-CoA kinase [Candidatus Peregrinibacteria bacterium CG_4_10_14_3_um_filter_44_21]PJB88335.1 MAG: dephospho-CoA kinase [Candidatus Peregrinibacteria bacterium CG_4_9_1
MKNKQIIGIIGGVASGKSFAGHFFQWQGSAFIDCDEIVATLYEKGGMGSKKIETFFGEEFMKEGAVDKARLGIFVSKDEKKLRILEKIIHPLVLSETQKAIDKAQTKVVFVEIGAPVDKFLRLCDKIILIAAPRDQRIKRIRTQYLQKIDSFKNLSKIRYDIKVINNFDKKTFGQKLTKVYNRITD